MKRSLDSDDEGKDSVPKRPHTITDDVDGEGRTVAPSTEEIKKLQGSIRDRSFEFDDEIETVTQVLDRGGGNVEEESICCVCMESHSSQRPILERHGCGSCAPDAWKICAICNETLLSRACPVCRSDYAPILLHRMPGHPLTMLADRSITDDERAQLLYKFGIVQNLIRKSNVAVWSPINAENPNPPIDGRMYFSLPREFGADAQSEQSVQRQMTILTDDANGGCSHVSSCMVVSIPMSTERIADGIFSFDNKVWDEIEREVDRSEEIRPNEVDSIADSAQMVVDIAKLNGVLLDVPKAVQWLLHFTKIPGAEIFAMVTPEDWRNMMDPLQSKETGDALQAIKNTIIRPKT